MDISNLSSYEGHLGPSLGAISKSLESGLHHRHGCVVVNGGKIISESCNTVRSRWGGVDRCTTHAEMAALLPLSKGPCFL